MQTQQLLAIRPELDAKLRDRKNPVTLLFTDLAGSAAYFERFGSEAGIAWIEDHYKTLLPKIAEQGGAVVKTLGDTVLAYFDESARAMAAAMAIQQTLLAGNRGKPRDQQTYVRIALHHGLAFVKGSDIFGDVVNVAARIAKTCRPGQILASQAVYANVGPQEHLRPVGESVFHGKSGSEQLYEVLWTDEVMYQAVKDLFPVRQAPTHDGSSEGRYIMINELGRGAMGVVYKAYDKMIGRTVAMKTMPVEVPENRQAALLSRLKQEAQAAGALDHPNIVTVYDVGDEAGLFYFTMQYVEGRTLASYHESKQMMPMDQIYELADQMCAAIGFAHSSGIVHRDIKPSNLMITPQGTLKVLDFGVAKFGEAGLTTAGAIVGTPSYLAPEQAAGRRVDHRADIFAIGAVLYELITCERAFPGESTTSIIYKILNEDPIPPRVIEPSLPEALNGVIRKALSKDPAKRFQSCEEMRAAIRTAKRGKEQVAAVPTMAIREYEQPAEESHKKWLIMAAIAVVIVGMAAGLFIWKWKPANPVAQPAPATEPANSEPAPQPAAVAPPAAKPAEPKPVPVSKKEDRAAREREKRSAREEAAASKREEKPAAKAEGGMWTKADIPDLLALADSYVKKSNYQRAISAYEAVLQLEPSNPTAQDGLRRAKSALGLRR